MNQDNEWVSFFGNHIFTVVHTDDESQQVRVLAEQTGVAPEDIKVYEGREGYKEIDPTGKHHGLKGKLVRALQNFGEELPRIRQFAEHMKKGHIGLGFPYRDNEHKEELLALLKPSPARELLYTTATNFYDVTP